MNIEMSEMKNNSKKSHNSNNNSNNTPNNPLFDTSSNEDSYVNIDMDIDNDTFIKSANEGYINNSNSNSNSNSNTNSKSKMNISEDKLKHTYNIPIQRKLDVLNNELDEVSNKSTIYEYHFEKLNKIYDGIGFVHLILDLTIILVGSISLVDSFEFEPEIIVIILGFINSIFTGISKLFKYKDKIAYIGKYISDLEHLKDNINIALIKIEYENITDQEYLRQLEKINLIRTSGNSSIFNIDSREYYNYYDRMKQIKEKKRKINHEIHLEKERKYNEFSKKHLNYLANRLSMKKKLKDIHEQVKANNIVDFYESDVFTITNLTADEE